MFDPQMMLLSTGLAAVVARLDEDPAGAWAEARSLVEAANEEDPELGAAIEVQDEAALREIVDGWASGKRLLTVHDRGVLKRALKAYRKSFKVTRLDAESTIGGGPMSAGRESSIVGIKPPDRYPRDVWDELARQGRLIDRGQGTFELPPE